MSTTTLPLSALSLSAKNVRQNPGDVSALATSIALQGLLQNLIVSDNGDGTYGVDGGGRRLAAMQLLAAQGDIAADYPVPVRIVSESERTAASLTENVQREAMHPADEFEAFKRLADEGLTVDRIADAFGVTPLVVERRLKLAAAAPAILELFRADQITTDQVIALCSTDDHALQVAVWERNGKLNSYSSSPAQLRRAVLESEITADDARVAFIGGVEVYKAAGGTIRADLFGGVDGAVILTDAALVGQLVNDKLEAAAESVRAEGWGWVQVWQEWDYNEAHRLGTLPRANVGTLPADVAAQRAAHDEARALAEHKIDQLDRLTDEEGRNYTDAEREQIRAWEAERDAADAAVAAIDDAHRAYDPAVMALAGAVVGRCGPRLNIIRGQVRAADRKALAALGGKANGGRETEAAGRKSGDTVSDALRRSLLGHRNLAAQSVLASRPDVAKILQAVWAVHEIRGATARFVNRSNSALDWCITDRTSGTRCNHPITDESGKAAAEAFAEMCGMAVDELPEDDASLWGALAAMEPSQLDALITYSVAMALSLAPGHEGITGKVLEALGFDMADHFQPTHANYTSRVSRQLNIAALDEANAIKGEEDRAGLLAMKKDELARATASRLIGSGWVPAEIRTPSHSPKTVKSAAKKPGKKASR